MAYNRNYTEIYRPDGRDGGQQHTNSSYLDYPTGQNILEGRGQEQQWEYQMQQKKQSLPRTISDANLELVGHKRADIVRDFVKGAPRGGTVFFSRTPHFTITLPSFENYPTGFKQFIFDRILDRTTQKRLEEENVLNWCKLATKLSPLNTLADGNCLLHSASLAMWGFQDRNLTLRRAVSAALSSCESNMLYLRWRTAHELENQQIELQLEPQQWIKEWDILVQLAATDVPIGKSLDSLNDFHVFVLANVLRRPIIMYSAPKIRSIQGGGTLQKINFQGIYLPLLWDPNNCGSYPLPLVYYSGHFSALSVIDSPSQYHEGSFVLPLDDYYGDSLPVKFILSTEDGNFLCRNYLKLTQIYLQRSPYRTATSVTCAILEAKAPPYMQELISNFYDILWGAYNQENGSGSAVGDREERQKCINNCGAYGDQKYSYMCSKCYQRYNKEAEMNNQQYSNRLLNPEHSACKDNSKSHPGNQRGVQHGGGSSLGTVKCPKCSEPGFPQLLGMCRRCYDRNTGTQSKESIYEKLPNEGNQGMWLKEQPPALPLPRDPNEQSYCRSPGCGFFGTKEYRYYCSKCFETNMERILKEADEGHPMPNKPVNTLSSAARPSLGQDVGAHKKEPPKCSKCNDFFANEEYQGMCHGCFMELTKSGGPMPQEHFSRPGGNPRTVTAPHPQRQQEEGHYAASRDNYSDKSHFNPDGDTTFYRQHHTTAPIANLSSQMSGMDITTDCFMCSGSPVGGSARYTVCARHAESMSRLIIVHKEEDEVKSKPVSHYEDLKPRAQYTSVSRNYSNQILYDRQEPNRTDAVGGGGGDARRNRSPYQNYQPGERRIESPYDIPYHHRDPLPHKSQVGYNEPSYNRRFDYESSSGLKTSHSQDYYRRQQYNEPVSSLHQYSSEQQHRQYELQFLNYPYHGRARGSSAPEDRNIGRTERDMHSSQVGDATGTAGRDRDMGIAGRDVQGEGGGAKGGVGGAFGGGFKKTLCAIPGCSFKGYSDLNNLCPDCFKDQYPLKAAEISELIYPLV